MSRIRDIAKILGQTEAANTTNTALAASGEGVTVYTALDSLPSTGLTSGDQAWVESSSRLYISNGSGWYNIALINATPRLTISPSGTIELSTDGTATTITLLGTDSDNSDASLTYSVESDGSFGGLATLSQDSSVFTITPLGEDSATTTTSTLTFKASDGINFGSGNSILTLEFTVPNSNYTTFLLQADSDGTDDQVDASSNNSTVGEVNDITSTAFTPYHPGGYSYYFAGDTGDYFTIESPTSALSFGTSTDFCIEMWVYPFDASQSYILCDMRPDETNGAYLGTLAIGSNELSWYHNGTEQAVTSGSVVKSNEWNHLVFNRDGDDINMFVNGTRQHTTSVEYNFLVGKLRLFKNAYSGGGIADGSGGYIRDYRIVKGNSVYGAGTTYTQPTQPLTEITGTSLLLFQQPYLHEEVGTETVSFTGGETSRFGPYNYAKYTTADYGGSVEFNGTDDYLTVDSGYLTTNTAWWNSSGFTIEVWLYKHNTNNVVILDNRVSGNTNGFIFKTHSDGFYMYANSAERTSGNGTNPVNSWTHAALVCSGTTGKIFQDGVQVGSDFTIPDTASYDYFGRSQNTIGAIQYTPRGTGSDYNGYMSDLRISSGSRYSGSFTPPTEPFANDGSTVFLTCTNKNDIWDTGQGAMLKKTGTVAASNTQRKFTTSSAVYFDGTDAVEITPGYDDPLYNFGTHDWTVEGWFYFSNLTGGRNLLTMLRAGATATIPHFYTDGDTVKYYVSGADKVVTSSVLSLSTWHHIAWVRNGNDHKIYVDGTASGTTWTQAQTYTQGRPTLGDYYSSLNTLSGQSNLFVGYMQSIRFTKGLARYTTNFTPSTEEFKG